MREPSAGGLPELCGAHPPSGLYLHVPFCAHLCHYCDFSVAPTKRPAVEEWLECVEVDLRDWFGKAGWDRPLLLTTIFLGGGTPSLLGAEGILRLRELLRAWFAWEEPGLEWTVEANPGSTDPERCEAWKRASVTRLSIGVQSFDDRVLRWLGRLHDARRAAAAIREARGAGLADVSLDLMFGLPEDLPRDWEAEVRQAVESGATHVSTYGLTAEPRTPLGRKVELGRVRLAGEERYAEEYLRAGRALREAGFEHYEVSNFALRGHEARHNWSYWRGGAVLGVGPSAHSFLPPIRVWNVRRWEAYREAALSGASLRGGGERLDATQQLLERVWLGLRTREGFSLPEQADSAEVTARIRRWEAQGWVQDRTTGEKAMRLTEQGWLRMDRLALELTELLTPGSGARPGARATVP